MSETDAPEPGLCVTLEPGLRRILAPNPSPMTYWGTNTYLVGDDDVWIIDPGPNLPAHLAAILAAIGSARVAGIAVTHAHLDHTALVPRLASETGAPVAALGTALDGRSEVMTQLAAQGLTEGGEGLDHSFVPDQRLRGGETFGPLTALETPGHAASHLSFAWSDAVFSGDTVMGWASTMVSPPDGDVAAFMHSTARLRDRGARIFYPGHGDPIPDPSARCTWLLSHRQTRETAILEAIGPNGATIQGITQTVYTDAPPKLLPAAERNVFAHLIDLTTRNAVRAAPALSTAAKFFRT